MGHNNYYYNVHYSKLKACQSYTGTTSSTFYTYLVFCIPPRNGTAWDCSNNSDVIRIVLVVLSTGLVTTRNSEPILVAHSSFDTCIDSEAVGNCTWDSSSKPSPSSVLYLLPFPPTADLYRSLAKFNMNVFHSLQGSCPPIPDDLTCAQFLLDSHHPTRPLRAGNIPWLIEDATGRAIGYDEVCCSWSFCDFAFTTMKKLRAKTFGLANALHRRWGVGKPSNHHCHSKSDSELDNNDVGK